MENRTKSVPYNNDAEMYVLGSILLENNVINQMIFITLKMLLFLKQWWVYLITQLR